LIAENQILREKLGKKRNPKSNPGMHERRYA